MVAGVAVVVAIVAAIVAGGIVFFWQQGRASSLKRDLAAAQETAKTTEEKVKDLTAENADLEKKVKKLEKSEKQTKKQLKEQKQQAKQQEQVAGKLADGKYFGSLKEVSGTKREITTDLKQFLTGKKAEKAAIKDGVIKKGDTLPNDYYIRNESKQLRTLSVGEQPTVKILTKGGGSPKEKTVSFAELAKLFHAGGSQNAHLHRNGFWIYIDAGKIAKLEEQFVP